MLSLSRHQPRRSFWSARSTILREKRRHDPRPCGIHTLESLSRGVPGLELAAEPDREPELMRIRRPSLSNLGGTPGSDDHDRFMLVGRGD
jgi:hypothetical protein